jgi:Secretion system C-terminal sorting domain
MKKQFLFFIIIMLWAIHAFSQNLISNGSFEMADSCPTSIRGVQNWVVPNNEYFPPIYYSTCDTIPYFSVPENADSYQYPEDGHAYMGIVFFANYIVGGYYQYIQTKFTQPLTTTKKFTLSFYMNLVDNNQGIDYNKTIAINKTEALLSTWQIKNTDTANYGTARLNYKPQFVTNYFITDTMNWQKVSFTFVADSAYQYLTIGCFEPPDSIKWKVVIQGDGSIAAFYNIDNVSLYEIPDTLPPPVPEVLATASPNPTYALVTLGVPGNAAGTVPPISIFNTLGQAENVVVTNNSTAQYITLNFGSYASGMYYVFINSEDKRYTYKVVVQH